MRRSLELLRLDTLAGGAPFYAISSVLHGRIAWTRRDYVEIFLILAGEGALNTLGDDARVRSAPITPGQLIFLRPRDTYQTVGSGPSGMSCYVVSMPVTTWQNFATLIGLSSSWLTTHDPPQVLTDLDADRIVAPFRRAVERYRTGATMFDITEFLVDVWPHLLPASPVGRDSPEPPPWLSEAITGVRLEANLRQGLGRLRVLAHVSDAHLARTVRAYFGMTPGELILELRLHHAAMLLATTTEGIGAIAERCGFATSSHFGAVFRGATGVTPREYRRRRLGGFVVASVAGTGWPASDLPADASTVLPPSPHPPFEADADTVVIYGR
jgi:AraC-like DNA-binding protein